MYGGDVQGMYNECQGRMDEGQEWYEKIMKEQPHNPGALKRQVAQVHSLAACTPPPPPPPNTHAHAHALFDGPEYLSKRLLLHRSLTRVPQL